MKKNLALSLITLTGLTILTTQAMEEVKSIQIGSAAPQYNGFYLTPQNIAQFAQMPEQEGSVVKEWTQKNKTLLHKIVPTSNEIPTTMEGRLNELCEAKKQLEEKDYALTTLEREINGKKENLPSNTLVFRLPGKKFVAQISTSIHKQFNILAFNGRNWNSDFDHETDKFCPTYQTVSRVFATLLGLQAVKKENITNFIVPKSYIVQIPEREDIFKEARDENSLVLQETMKPNLLLLKDNPKVLEKLDQKTIADTYCIIKKALLWNFYNNCYFDESNKTLIQYDFQQRSHHNPELVFYTFPTERKLHAWKTDGKVSAEYFFENDITCGIEGLATLLNEALQKGHNVMDQCKTFKELIENDLEIKQFKNKNFSDRINDALPFKKPK